MPPRNAEPTPIEAFLAPLARHARAHRDLDGLVFWGGADGWDASPSEALDPEEIAFYAEGLLLDGFHMQWTLAATAEAPTEADHIRLAFWQDGSAAPPLPQGWVAMESGLWTSDAT